MLALVRDGAWEWSLLFHVLGALLLTGSLVLVTILAVVGRRHTEAEGTLAWRRYTFRTLLFLVVPSYLLMRIAAEWVRSEDAFPDDQAWVGVGYVVTDVGLLLLLALLAAAWWSTRQARRGVASRVAPRIVMTIAPFYLVALLVAVWAMSAKPA